MIRLTVQTALVCLIAFAAAGCAVEVPKSAFSAFQLGPMPKDTGPADTHSQRHQDVKHISVP
jgi:hypothetical protein